MAALPGARFVGSWMSRQAVRRGLLGSSRLWLGVFVAGRVARMVRRVVGPRKPETLLTQKLAPGSGIAIRHLRRGRD